MRVLSNQSVKRLFSRMLGSVLLFLIASLFLGHFTAEKAALWITLGGVFLSLVILCLCWGYFQEQDKVIGDAVVQITDYLSGNSDARIECDEEGELYYLFHQVNALVSILNARARKEEQAKEFLKNTISDISHQLKTPLAALNIYNGILQEETGDPLTVREFADLSEQELDRIETLVQSLLKITKLDAGTIRIDRAPELVPEMMERVQRHFAYRAGQEGKEIRLEGDEEVRLFCDRAWLTEAIDNMVKNALDHTREGDVIRIEWKQTASAVQIQIADNGCGIHPEDLYHIFKRFYRSRFSKDAQGIGLGLPLAKAVIEAHGGTVEVDSILGSGTTFLIHFPIPTKL